MGAGAAAATPIDVAARVIKWFNEGTIWRHLWITLWEAALAFIVGSVAGVLTGFRFARQPMVAAVLDPYVKMKVKRLVEPEASEIDDEEAIRAEAAEAAEALGAERAPAMVEVVSRTPAATGTSMSES